MYMDLVDRFMDLGDFSEEEKAEFVELWAALEVLANNKEEIKKELLKLYSLKTMHMELMELMDRICDEEKKAGVEANKD